MKTAAICSTAFGLFLLAFAGFEYGIGDLECAASTSVLSGFFIVCGLSLFALSRRRRARLPGLAESDWARPGRPLSHEMPSHAVATSAPRVPMSDLSDVERSKTSDGYANQLEQVTDFGALAKRADVKKLIEELQNQTQRRQK